MPIKKKRRTGRAISPGSYGVFLVLFTAVVLVSHAPYFNLPFFWDEVGQFVPASLDLFRAGALIPRSVTPNAHPPGVMAYLAMVWTVAGYSVASTRTAMLLLGGVSLFLVFLLAIKLCGAVKGIPAFLVALAMCASPTFYAQAMLAQLDMPAMLFTVLAFLLFLEERPFLSALGCVALVLVKETGIVTPFVFGAWLLVERRFLPAGYFFMPAFALGIWFLYLHQGTGHFFGSQDFTYYNLEYMTHPVRTSFALAKRIYHLFWENLHVIGSVGILYGVVNRGIFEGRAWKIAWTLVAVHVMLFSVMGGAMLERYLLPVLPIVYIAMIAGWSATPSPWRTLGPVALIAGVAVCNFWNPPYPFPLENNLAFTDFVRLQQTAAAYIEERYPAVEVSTAWPLSAALLHPDFGYVKAAHRVREIRDFSEPELGRLDSAPVELFVLYSRQWDPPVNILRNEIVMRIWRRFFLYAPQVASFDVDQRWGLKPVAAWMRGGHWIEVHAKY